MAKGIFHLHLTVVILFLIFLLFKTALLLMNKLETLDKVREKTKIVDMILGTLIILTGGYLAYTFSNTQPYIIGKLIAVLLSIPLGIIGFKRKKKALALLSLLLIVYAYGVAETKSLTFKKQKYTTAAGTTDSILGQNSTANSANAKAIYAQLCERCHGQDGKLGVGGAKDLTSSTLSAAEREAIISNGKGLMPGFRNQLSEGEVKSLASYTESLKK